MSAPKIAVVIPCCRVKHKIKGVIEKIGMQVQAIYVVDDCCPDRSGEFVRAEVKDARVKVLTHEINQGVGGALVTGYKAALEDGCDIVVKLDGDGQMDPGLIPRFVEPIAAGIADYVKGNRFYALEFLTGMPPVRALGNSGLSFISKIASGYWDLMDPTNGYTAIYSEALRRIPLDKIDKRYFFESDMLFRLNIIRAVVQEVPMPAHYGDETSSLRISRTLLEFPWKYLNRFLKRIFYSYFLRDFNVCSLQLIAGLLLTAFGSAFGLWHWWLSYSKGVIATTGTVMVAALPVILGFQLLLAVSTYDVMNVPRRPLRRSLT